MNESNSYRYEITHAFARSKTMIQSDSIAIHGRIARNDAMIRR